LGGPKSTYFASPAEGPGCVRVMDAAVLGRFGETRFSGLLCKRDAFPAAF